VTGPYILVLLAGVALGALLGARWTVAGRSYRDAKATTKAARELWRQVPRNWARVAKAFSWPAVVAFFVIAYYVGRRH
jgi:hypothetical protein